MSPVILSYGYLLAGVCFILGLKWMTSPRSARRGVWISEVGVKPPIIGISKPSGTGKSKPSIRGSSWALRDPQKGSSLTATSVASRRHRLNDRVLAALADPVAAELLIERLLPAKPLRNLPGGKLPLSYRSVSGPSGGLSGVMKPGVG